MHARGPPPHMFHMHIVMHVTTFAPRCYSLPVCITMSDVDKLLAELLSDEDSEVNGCALQTYSCMPGSR